MADDDTPDTGTDAADDQKPDKPAGKDWEAEAAKWRSLARKHEDEAKQLRPLAKKAEEQEEANKTELQKALDRVTVAEQRATEAEKDALRIQVAFSKGLTPGQAKRLSGSTKEELESDADELLETFGGGKAKADTGDAEKDKQDKDGPAKSNGRPKEALRGGAVAKTEEPQETDPRKLAAMVPRNAW